MRPKPRYFVTLFPNSTAVGLNTITYGLMPRSLPGVSLHFWVRATDKKRRNRRVSP